MSEGVSVMYHEPAISGGCRSVKATKPPEGPPEQDPGTSMAETSSPIRPSELEPAVTPSRIPGSDNESPGTVA